MTYFLTQIYLQATPYHRLKTGLVPDFLQQLKQLVHHKDPSVVVGSLMAIEFLISSSGVTEEILDLIEIPRVQKPKEQKTAEM